MNLITPGSLSWAAFLEMGARHENSPNPKAPSVMMGLFFSYLGSCSSLLPYSNKRYLIKIA